MRIDQEGGKGGVHEEGMNIGSRPSKSNDGEWVEEDFGKPAEGRPVPKRPRKTQQKKTPKK